MNHKKPILGTLVVAGLCALGRPAAAAVYDLRAASTSLTMSDGTMVPMWGFGLTSATEVSIPGPVLEVPPGDTTLIINLTNELPVPVSIVIPGIPAPLTPVWDDGTSGPRTSLEQRAVSFTYVAQPGETVAYQWNDVQPGTYLYQSGTHPAVQVPMGLYGAVRHDAAVGQTHGIDFDRDLVLVYSEIDPELNGAVAGGSYGTPAYPTTNDYQARYFLVNGVEAISPPELAVGVNERLLLRVVNAGLRSVVPTLSAESMSLLAEDGQPAPFARDSYSMLLPAGKTRDALLVLAQEGSTVLFDRRGSSRLARITAGPVADAPVAAADAYDATEDVPLDTALAALPGVLDNDTGVALSAVLDGSTSAGTLALAADGSFVYTPMADFHGVDTFSYHATDGALSSNQVTVSITVGPANDAPVAAADVHEAIAGEVLAVAAPGVLGNDSDIDLDTLTPVLVDAPTGGTVVLSGDGSFAYSADPGTTTDSFTYQASDGVALSDVATVLITVITPVNEPPLAVNDIATTVRNTPVIIAVLGNDSDSDGTLDPASVAIASAPVRGGTATALGDGTVLFVPKHNYKGTDQFTYVVSDDDGAVSVPAKVRINVVQPW